MTIKVIVKKKIKNENIDYVAFVSFLIKKNKQKKSK